jgi:hypothetical protein
MTRILKLTWDAVAAWIEGVGVHTVEQLDERTLRDIGFEEAANLARERKRSPVRHGRC